MWKLSVGVVVLSVASCSRLVSSDEVSFNVIYYYWFLTHETHLNDRTLLMTESLMHVIIRSHSQLIVI
jgi:hypothetical protein